MLVELLLRPRRAERLKCVHLRGARITDTINLEGLSVNCPVVLQDCYLDERLVLREASMAALRLPGCRLPAGLDGRGISVRGSLELNDGFCVEGEALLDSARVGTWFDCTGGQFVNPARVAFSANEIHVGR